MEPRSTPGTRPDRAPQTLVIVDWKLDAEAVVTACAREHASNGSSIVLVVLPALHGIDWAGDPYANVPCARLALEKLSELLHGAGIPLAGTEVGDHDPVAAVTDAALSRSLDQIVVVAPRRRLPLGPLDLAHRAARATGLPARSLRLDAAPAASARRHWPRLARGECAIAQPA